MKKYLFLSLILFASSGAYASNSTTECLGSSFTDDGLVYDNIAFTARFDSNSGIFNLSADGHNDKLEYDINNRFSNLPFVGQLRKNSSGRIVSAKMSGNYLPGNRTIDTSIDMSRAETKSKITIERTDGVLIKSLLSCKTTLAPICHEEHKCRDHCHPMIGCDQICDTRTVCEPQKFD